MLRGLRMARIRPSRLRILIAGSKIQIGFTKNSFFKKYIRKLEKKNNQNHIKTTKNQAKSQFPTESQDFLKASRKPSASSRNLRFCSRCAPVRAQKRSGGGADMLLLLLQRMKTWCHSSLQIFSWARTDIKNLAKSQSPKEPKNFLVGDHRFRQVTFDVAVGAHRHQESSKIAGSPRSYLGGCMLLLPLQLMKTWCHPPLQILS